jgi:hypothetical protein
MLGVEKINLCASETSALPGLVRMKFSFDQWAVQFPAAAIMQQTLGDLELERLIFT